MVLQDDRNLKRRIYIPLMNFINSLSSLNMPAKLLQHKQVNILYIPCTTVQLVIKRFFKVWRYIGSVWPDPKHFQHHGFERIRSWTKTRQYTKQKIPQKSRRVD